MNWQDVLLAMLPEHILPLGIVLLIVLELVSDRPRGALGLALLAVVAATAAARCSRARATPPRRSRATSR